MQTEREKSMTSSVNESLFFRSEFLSVSLNTELFVERLQELVAAMVVDGVKRGAHAPDTYAGLSPGDGLLPGHERKIEDWIHKTDPVLHSLMEVKEVRVRVLALIDQIFYSVYCATPSSPARQG